VEIKVLLIAFLIAVVALSQCVYLTNANGMPAPSISQIYIRPDGSVEPSTAPIQQEGNVYTFVGAITSRIEVQRSYIIIDGADYTLSGYGSHWYTAINVSGSNVKIHNLNIKNFGWGIELDGSSGIIIVNNTFEGCAEAIHLGSSDRNYIAENIMSYSYGVSGKGSFNVIIKNNFYSGLSGSGQGVGVDLWYSNNNTIAGNYFNDRSSISVRGDYNTIEYNTMNDGAVGISLIEAECNKVFRNKIRGKNGSYAFYLAKAYSNEIYENHFESNSLAVQIGNTIDFGASGNNFYRNNFLNSAHDVMMYGTPRNLWNTTQVGNYWSGYAGNDTDGDGIGDTPYTINTNNIDNHPLMQSISIPESPDFKLIYPAPTIKQVTSPSPTPQPKPTPTHASSPKPIPTPTPIPDLSPSPTPQSVGSFPVMSVVTASAASIVVASVGLLFYFKKRKH
jgi:parallel beta-helix repeat protein